MSRHHRAQKWTTHSPKLRAAIAPQLPLPCVNGCGKPVFPDQKWQVGHRQGAARGGLPTLQNCGPAHVRCNLSDGGREGARVVNAHHQASTNGIRPW